MKSIVAKRSEDRNRVGRSDLKHEIGSVRSELTKLKTDMDRRFESSRTDTERQIALLRTDVELLRGHDIRLALCCSAAWGHRTAMRLMTLHP